MLAISSPLFSTNIGAQYWSAEDTLGHESQHYFFRDLEHSTSSAHSLSLNFPAPTPSDQWLRAEIGSSEPTPTALGCRDLTTAVKKLNHNASERDRRRKVNQLYSSLRGLLPASEHTKKLSIPATVSKVVKYIPELQQQVEGLVQKRDELYSKMNSRQLKGKSTNLQVKQETHHEIKTTFPTPLPSTVSASQLNDKEVAVQISAYKVDKNRFSETLRDLEEDGLSLQNASSFESLGGRVFHNLHLKVKSSCSNVKYGPLGEKLNLSSTMHINGEFLL